PRPRARALDRRHQPRPFGLRRRPVAERRVHPAADRRHLLSDGRRMTDVPASFEKVFEAPDLLLRTEHSLCPGCGEPVALRTILELIRDLGLRERTICVAGIRSEEHTSELQSRGHLVCRLL